MTDAQQQNLLSEVLLTETCPACGHHVAVPFYDGGRQPLTTLAWPPSPEAAEAMPRLPLNFVRCIDCGHVYNADFEYAEVPYQDKPNLMFNNGAIWTDHLRTVRDSIADLLPRQATVVEIGCGEGHLLRALADVRPDARYIGFDPNSKIETDGGRIDARACLFDPAVHLAECRPDLIISRHVLEHLMNPLGFIQALAFAASWEDVGTRLFLEVPCIDHVLDLGRTVDFFYEHNSHFTTTSLRRLLERCATDVQVVETSYNGEVVYGIASFCQQSDQVTFARQALAFRAQASRAAGTIRQALDELSRSGKRVAVWGGTGKAAAFMNQHGLDRRRFPLVVDSDAQKAGTFVPGTGQCIQFRDVLLNEPADVILIATQWRAADIVLEIQRHGIEYAQVLIEHRGQLIDYFSGEHPYRIAAHESAESKTAPVADRSSSVPRPWFMNTPTRPLQQEPDPR